MREQIQQTIAGLHEAADQLNGFDNLMHETLHGIADDLEAAIAPQWVPVVEPSCHDRMVMVSYRSPNGDHVTHWHPIDYPEPPAK